MNLALSLDHFYLFFPFSMGRRYFFKIYPLPSIKYWENLSCNIVLPFFPLSIGQGYHFEYLPYLLSVQTSYDMIMLATRGVISICNLDMIMSPLCYHFIMVQTSYDRIVLAP